MGNGFDWKCARYALLGRNFWQKMWTLAGKIDMLNMCVDFGGKVIFLSWKSGSHSNRNCFKIVCFGFRNAFLFQNFSGHFVPPYYTTTFEWSKLQKTFGIQ